MNIRNPSWFKVIFEWLAIMLSVGIVFMVLASGYSWTLPVLGMVPGPSSPAVMRVFNLMFIVCLLSVIVASIPVLVSGSWGKRVAGGIPVFVVFLIVAMLVYSRFN